MNKRTAIILTIALLLLTYLAGAQSFKFNHYGAEDGIETLFVYSIDQDENGFLLVGTDRGLYNYDGFKFQPQFQNDSLAQGFVRCSMNDGQGRIWYGYDHGQIAILEDGQLESINLQLKNNSKINDISMDADGATWVASQSGGVVRIDGEGNQATYSILEGEEDLTEYEMYSFKKSGEHFLVGSGIGLYMGKEALGKRIECEPVMDIAGSKVTDIEQLTDGDFLVSTDDMGLFKVFLQGEEALCVPVRAQDVNLQRLVINDITISDKGSVYLSTNNAGLIQISREKSGVYTRVIDYSEGGLLGTKSIHSSFVDREGNLWISAIGKGVAMLVDDYFSYYDIDGAQSAIKSIATKNDTIWLITPNRIYVGHKSPDHLVAEWGVEHGLPDGELSTLEIDMDNNLWVGTQNSGLFVKSGNDEVFTRIDMGQDFLSNRINDMVVRKNMIWAATDAGIYQIKDGEVVAQMTMQSGLPHNVIESFYKDRDGSIWIATPGNELCNVDNIINIEELPQFDSWEPITCFTQDRDGTIWYGTEGSGVFKVSKTETTRYTSADGLGSDYCYSIICDDKNRLWVGHRGSLSRINTTQNKVDVFTGSANESFEFKANAVACDEDDILWFGTSSGVLRYDPEKDILNHVEPALNICEVNISDSIYTSRDEIGLPNGKYKINFDFVGISFSRPEKVTYQYILEGHENEWSDLDTKNYMTYNGLDAGEYLFKVKCFNSDGIGGETIEELKIFIDKPFWAKWWFIVFCLGTIFFTVRFIVAKREKAMKKTQEYLKTELDARTREVVEQKELLEVKNKDITDSIIYAKNIQKAMLPPPGALSEHFPESFVFFKPRDIVSGDFYWVEEFDDYVILACADCTGHGVPGAFMSLIGSALLKEIARMSTISSPNEALGYLDKELGVMLNKENNQFGVEDGMDISLVEFNKKTKILRGAGARRPIIIYKDGIRHELKGDRFSIGGSEVAQNEKHFTLHEMKLSEGDSIYQFSDGIADQFGGELGKKLKKNRLLSILDDLTHLDMAHQGRLIRQRFFDWKGSLSQVDDVIMVGIRV